MTDTPLTAAIRYRCCADWPKPCSYHEGMLDGLDAQASTIAALTTRAEQAEARVAELTAALTEQGLLQNTATGVIWHVHDCPASFDFAECNYRCRVAREAFARAGTEPYVSQETRRDTEVYE